MSVAVAEKKKVFGLPHNVGIGLLCVLGAICLYEFYDNVIAGPGVPNVPRSAPQTASGATPSLPSADSEASAAPRRQPPSQRRTEEFNPPFRAKRTEDRPDLTKIDPTLRTDLLAKVQAVELAGGARNLFQMGAPPPKPTDLPPGTTPKIFIPIGPRQPPAPVVVTTTQGPIVTPLPIQLKFYGFSKVRGTERYIAYFLDGEDILLGGEGDVLKKKYRIKKIQTSSQSASVLMEDIDGKRTETIPLTPPDQS